MAKDTDKLLVEILQELRYQSRITMFIAVSGSMIGLYLVAYTAVLILIPNPNTNFAPFFNFAFTDALVILVIVIFVYFLSLKVGKKVLKWLEEV